MAPVWIKFFFFHLSFSQKVWAPAATRPNRQCAAVHGVRAGGHQTPVSSGCLYMDRKDLSDCRWQRFYSEAGIVPVLRLLEWDTSFHSPCALLGWARAAHRARWMEKGQECLWECGVSQGHRPVTSADVTVLFSAESQPWRISCTRSFKFHIIASRCFVLVWVFEIYRVSLLVKLKNVKIKRCKNELENPGDYLIIGIFCFVISKMVYCSAVVLHPVQPGMCETKSEKRAVTCANQSFK